MWASTVRYLVSEQISSAARLRLVVAKVATRPSRQRRPSRRSPRSRRRPGSLHGEAHAPWRRPLSPGVAFTSADLWYISFAPPPAASPSPSSSSGSAATAVAFVGDSTSLPGGRVGGGARAAHACVLIKWRVNGETTENVRAPRAAKTTTTLARCDHVIVCTGKNDIAFGVASSSARTRWPPCSCCAPRAAQVHPRAAADVHPQARLPRHRRRGGAADCSSTATRASRCSRRAPATPATRGPTRSTSPGPSPHRRAFLDETVAARAAAAPARRHPRRRPAAPAAAAAQRSGGGPLRLRGGVRGRRERGRVRGRGQAYDSRRRGARTG